MNKLDVLFLGGVFPKHSERKILENSIGSIQFAANALQWNIINGLDENLSEPINLLNALFIGSYPRRYKELFVKESYWSHTGNAKDQNIKFLNLMGYKHLSRKLNLREPIKEWASGKGEQKVLIIYSMHTPFLYAAKIAKKINPEIKICIIVPDLPQYMNSSMKKWNILKLFKKWDINEIHKNLRYVDSYVLLTKQMAEKLKVTNKPYTVIEGIVDSQEPGLAKPTSIDSDEKIIVYTGTLAKRYGIMNLVNSWKYIESPNYKLIICGEGEVREEIEELSKSDPRIRFKGNIPHSQALELQRKATVLVNPRTNEGEYTKYSFPSKTMEYMLSGNPVMMYKLDGIPAEYDEFLSYFNSECPQDIAQGISQLCELPSHERKEIGEKSKNFVLEKKNSKYQTKKIIDMILSGG